MLAKAAMVAMVNCIFADLLVELKKLGGWKS